MKRIITVDVLIRYLLKVKFGELSLIKAALKTFIMKRIVAQLPMYGCVCVCVCVCVLEGCGQGGPIRASLPS